MIRIHNNSRCTGGNAYRHSTGFVKQPLFATVLPTEAALKGAIEGETLDTIVAAVHHVEST